MADRTLNLVVVPAYNEQHALPATIARLQSLPDNFELLVINDGSSDLTSHVAHELAASSRLPLHVIDLPLNSGVGVAVQTGYLFAAMAQKYDYVIQFDADGQHNADSLVALVEASDENDLDLCIGSRFLQPGEDGLPSAFRRRIGIRFLSWLIGALGGARITDPTTGFRCAGPRAWMDFVDHYPDDYPEPESLYWCLRNGLRVGEIAVVAHERGTGRSSSHSLRRLYYLVKVTLAILIDMLRPKEDPLL